ncbi:hypothetical protein COLO4_36707 [Corchorus olitorius]|uniref:Uncharacterized protein n=1 Tax=Corchorus olitorius TaxID=93759 RepID=A0A1R3G610_9ROSI|nr:hypothetical protein COLO4_36707 [Corchorus olitorius]
MTDGAEKERSESAICIDQRRFYPSCLVCPRSPLSLRSAFEIKGLEKVRRGTQLRHNRSP